MWCSNGNNICVYDVQEGEKERQIQVVWAARTQQRKKMTEKVEDERENEIDNRAKTIDANKMNYSI